MEESNINGCINRNVYSSMLFIIPTLYAYVLLPYYSELMVGSMLCLITSVYHHYYKAEIGFFKTLDRIVVNSIGFFFTLRCIIKIGSKFYANIMYFIGILAWATFYYVSVYNSKLYCDYHCLVHIFAVIGILFCIKAHETYLLPEDK
jgi:hypothetical protein